LCRDLLWVSSWPIPELASTRLVPRTNEAFRLLRAYLMGLRDNGGISDPSLCKLAVTHVYDLVALTPRTVQLLFEETETTFTAYARDECLNLAHQMLCDARYSRWSISAIAYRAGFGDLSHFNHVFRRRYGATPSEVREEAESLAPR
jgi:AraC-like DNA-binding protein